MTAPRPTPSPVLAAGRRRALGVGLGLALAALQTPLRAQPAAAQARLRWSLDRDARRLEVGEVILLHLEVWVSTWFQAPVEFPATLVADGAMIEWVGGSPDSRFEEFGGRRWTGLIRRYRVMAVQPGELLVSLPGPLQVQPGAGKLLQLLPPPPLRLQVHLPPGAEDIQPFVAARKLELRQRWWPQEGTVGPPEVGDLIRREIVLVTDSSSPLLPPPDFGQPANVAVHVQAASLDEQRAHAAATPIQTQRHVAVYTLQREGPVELPAVELVWWDMQARQRRVSRLEGLRLQVQPTAERPDPFALTPPAAVPLANVAPAGSAGRITRNAIWLAAAAAGLGAAGWYRWRPIAAAAQRLRPPGQAHAWRKLRLACRRNDASTAEAALTVLLQTLAPETRLRWLQDAALAAAMSHLGRQRFGPATASVNATQRWQGQVLWQALTSLRQAAHDPAPADPLPTLHP